MGEYLTLRQWGKCIRGCGYNYAVTLGGVSLCPRPPSRACNKTGGSEREAWYNLSREGRKEVERT